MQKKFKLILIGLILLAITGVTNAVPAITPTPAGSSFTTFTNDLPYDFSVSINESANVTWYVDNTSVKSVVNQTSDTYSATEPVGEHNVTVFATNSNGSSSFKWTWTVNESVLINSSSPDSDPSTIVGDSQVFTVDTNQIANIIWYINGAEIQTNTSQTSANYTNTTAPVDTYTVKATASNANGSAEKIWTWDVTATPAPSITLDDPSSTTVSDNTGDSRTFKVSINQPVNITWMLNGTSIGTNNSVNTSSHTFDSAPEGNHNLTVYVENANGTDQEKWDWNVTTSGPDTTAPGSVSSLEVDEKGTDWIKWKWTNPTDSDFDYSMVYIGDKFIENVSTEYYTTASNLSASTNYTIKLHTVDDSGNINTTDVTNTTKTYPKTYFTGDRIWDGDNADQSRDNYTWDAKSFSGFFYDLESGLSSESLTISNIRRTLREGDILYKTSPVDTDFEHSDWGSYQVIGFMAEEYFAGYTDNTSIAGVDELSLISSGQLSKILINNDEKETVYSGSSIILEDGYELNIVQVDLNGDQVLVTLTKDGDEVDTGIVSSNDDYVYKEDLGDADDVIILVVHFNQIFQGRESNMVVVEGFFQISDEYLELESGDSYGDMEITSISDTLIEMENDGSVSLSKGKSINLMGKIKLLVADNDDLRFAPVVDMSEPGTYELRGTVAEENELLTWTPLNFEGFYYDIDEGIQTETLELTAISGRSIASGKLVYTSTPASVEFEHSEWGKFNVMGFMAEKYFAGYTTATDIAGVDELNLISDGQLSKVLVDEDSKVSVSSGSELVLEEGYTLQIVQVDVNGESVLIDLYKDGDKVDTDIVSANDDYVFEKELGDADDVPIIIIHFDEVFSGRESDAIFVEGMFQISEDYITLETGEKYGDMEIDSFGDSIVMSNDKSISLNKDKEIKLMDNVKIKVADSNTLRYYPYVEVKTAASETLNVELSQSTVVQGEEITITVNARGASIADATVKVEGRTIGTTDSDGTLVHSFSESGTFEITVERDDYATGSEDIEVIGKDDETKKMSIEVSPDEVYEGTSMTIFVLKAIGGDGIPDATVTFDKKIIGTTDDDGTISYTATEAGTHKITASKSGLLDAEFDLRVDELAAKFEFSNIMITPLEIKQGKEATISVDVVNTGTDAGDYNVNLKVNDVVVDSQLISLSVGNSTTIEFSHVEEEPGTYEVEIGGITTTYEVFEKSSTWLYILGAILLVAIGGIAYLFTAGGWTVEIAQAKVAEAIESIKELVGNIR
ncbi:MAG: S-layer protein domain-containing protein [Methanolobus sp.]|nr:S-layer protein domain-containing protein [Methanolobus sp.]